MPVDDAMRNAGHRVGNVIVTAWRVVDRIPATPCRSPLQLGNLVHELRQIRDPDRAGIQLGQ